jgi:hypothetical protein
MICAAIYNSRRTKDSQPILSPDDFIPSFRQTAEEAAARHKKTLDQFVSAFSSPAPKSRRIKKE